MDMAIKRTGKERADKLAEAYQEGQSCKKPKCKSSCDEKDSTK